MKYRVMLVTILGFISFYYRFSFADTVVLTSGVEEKGIVVEEYADRIIFSQEKGEIEILKKDIKDIHYDAEEQNLLALGNLYKEKGNLNKALEYYKKALDTNPNFKEAKDAVSFVAALRLREQELRKKSHIRKIAELADPTLIKKYQTPKTAEEEIRDKIGISFVKEKEGVRIKQIARNSPAEIAGLYYKDLIISIWGTLIGYSDENEIKKLLLDPRYKEVKFVIQRDLFLTANVQAKSLEEYYGFTAQLDEEGFKIADVREESSASKANLETGDFLCKVNDESVRYMSLDKLKSAIKESTKKGMIKLTVRKEIALIKKE
ncbi:MAG: PDZ domain-containing protein [Candidatus Omnitrophota bacterium]